MTPLCTTCIIQSLGTMWATPNDVNSMPRTASKELSMPGRKTTNSGVSAIGEGGVEYYGRLEEVYELHYYGENPPNVVVFKCHWFDPSKTRRAHEHVGLVEIRQDRKLSGDDV